MELCEPYLQLGAGAKTLGRGLKDKVRSEADDTFCESMLLLFWTGLKWMHDYTIQFNMKCKKDQLGGRKVVVQATILAHLSQKVDERLPAVPSRLRRQYSQGWTWPDLGIFKLSGRIYGLHVPKK